MPWNSSEEEGNVMIERQFEVEMFSSAQDILYRMTTNYFIILHVNSETNWLDMGFILIGS